jgi:ABC-type enterobactin transport system permease subunit
MCVLKRFMAGGLADVFSEQVCATVARSTLRGCVAMISVDNLTVHIDQSSRLMCRLLTELSGQVYLIYTHAT